jgi:cbb3-type cytochrome oxidase subunit 3
MSWEEEKAKSMAFFLLLVLGAIVAWAFWPKH